MADIISSLALIILSLLDLARASFLLSLPFWIAAWTGSWLRKKIADATGLSWILSVSLVLYSLLFLSVLLVYGLPLLLSLQEFSQASGVLPGFFTLPPSDILVALLLSLLRVLLVSLVLFFFFAPFVLAGSFLREALQKKFRLKPAYSLFGAVFLCTSLALSLVLFLFPFLPQAFFYLLYFR